MGAYAHGQISQNLGGLPFPNLFSVWATGFNVSWEPDFWGRYRRTIEATDADVGASVEGYNQALVLLLSDVASNYVQMRTYEERLRFARSNVEIQKGSLHLADLRFTGGIASELDVRQARSSLAQTEALIPPLEAGRRQAANQLCILMGMPVTELASQLPPGGIPKPPLQVAAGIPAELLRRRPDVRRAERQVASQSARIGVAEADLYPRFAINGFLGYAANDLNNLFEPKSFLGFIIPQFQWNVLNYGRITNNIRAQEARWQTAVLQYQQTVLTAGREVEDSLVAFLQSQQQAARLDEGVAASARSVQLVMTQFEGGVTDFNRVYNTQTTLVNQQDQLAATRGNIALNLIAAYRALGGGWQYFTSGGGASGPPADAPQPTPAQPQSQPAPIPLPAPPDPVPAEDVRPGPGLERLPPGS